jgi:hypothetical protein
MSEDRTKDTATGLLKEQPCKRGIEYGSVEDLPTPYPVKQEGTFWGGTIEWLRDLEAHFGYNFLVLIFVAQHLVIGILKSFVIAARPYVYTDYGVDAAQQLICGGITSLPVSCLRPLIGLVTDTVPVAGYLKAPYFVAGCLLGGAGLFTVGSATVGSISTSLLVLCLFAFFCQVSVVGVIAEGAQAVKMQEHPQRAPQLLSFVWLGEVTCVFLANLSAGALIQGVGAESLLLLVSAPAFLAGAPALLGFLEERYQTDEDLRVARARVQAQGEVCFLSVLMVVAGAAVMAAGLLYDTRTVCAVSISSMLVLLLAHSLLLTPVIAKLSAYILIQGSLSWSITPLEFYFYTDDAEAYPEGPHFSTMFYNSVLGPMAALITMTSIAMYRRYMSNWSYRNLLVCGNFAALIARLMEAAMFARLNTAVGISDYALLLNGHADARIHFWQWLPCSVLVSLVCPKGMEATVSALLGACYLFTVAVGSSCGALLLEALGVNPGGGARESAQFENAGLAALIVAVLPLTTVALVFVLVPDFSPSHCEPPAGGSAVQGSLVRRWLEGRARPSGQGPGAA